MLLDNNLSYTKGDFSGSLTEDTIGLLLERQSNLYPDKEALVSMHQNKRVSYQELNTKVNQLASGLLSIGVKKVTGSPFGLKIALNGLLLSTRQPK